MPTNIEQIIQPFLRKNIPDIQPGDTVRVHQKVKEGEKERIQVFEGIVLARKHGKGINATITVRRVNKGYGVERVFPIHSPALDKIEIVKRAKVRRAKLYYLRKAKGKKGRLRARTMGLEVSEPEPAPEPEPKSTEGEEKPAKEEVKKEEPEKK
ncbi:50S ribosomal protein L19 [Patescibacteria group bacterium]|nr:50S ribosomal protein L19 [Patescibacteria group bacterium]